MKKEKYVKYNNKNWKHKKLSDFITLDNGISYKGKYLSNNGVPMVNLGNITYRNGFNLDKLKYYTGDYGDKHIIKTNDIIIANTDITQNRLLLGSPAIIPKIEFKKIIFSLDLFIVRHIPQQNDLNNYFLYYLLQSIDFHNHVISYATGTTVLHLSKAAVLNFQFLLPSMREQNVITKILSDLDAKIRNIENQNKILEQIVQSIFKSWFINFNAVTEFEDSELGKIPKGWHWEQLDNIAVFLNGLPLQKFRPINRSFLPVIKIREMKNGITKNTEKARSDIDKKYVVNNGDVLFSWSGSLELTIWEFGDGALNQHLFKVTSTKYEKWFYYMWIKYHLDDFRRIAKDKTTTMGHIQRYHISEAIVIIPTSNIIKKMNLIMNPFFKQTIQNKTLIQNLIKIRDNLLPKLMSGEIKV